MPPPLKKRKLALPKPGDGTTITTIRVPSGDIFTVHAHLLDRCSEYFRRALDSKSTEAKTRTFDLSEHATSATLSIFIRWLYHKSTNRGATSEFTRDSSERYEDVVEAWFFGDYIQATEFRNDIIHILNDYTDRSTIPLVWDRVPPGSRLRGFFVASFLHREGPFDGMKEDLGKLPPSMLLEVSRRLVDKMIELHDCRQGFSVKKYLDVPFPFDLEPYLEKVED
ncbi:hypothetical protein M426DRAFT_182771 [Hypoxylon sp. CI-4A]|nr:hypothetical protein M426DRAFT_182771 [Hypoxylon sp. CI-4A]